MASLFIMDYSTTELSPNETEQLKAHWVTLWPSSRHAIVDAVVTMPKEQRLRTLFDMALRTPASPYVFEDARLMPWF